MKKRVIDLIFSNMAIRKIAIYLRNKIVIKGNRFVCDSTHFANNKIVVNGSENEVICHHDAFFRHSKVIIAGNNNIIEFHESFNGNSINPIMIRGANNHIIIGCNTVMNGGSLYINGCNNYITVKDNCSITHLSVIMENNDNRIDIGCNTTFHGREGKPVHMHLLGKKNIQIGEDCMFSNNIELMTSDCHSIISQAEHIKINEDKNIVIGNHCWIGLNAILLKGTVIGSHCVVGAGSICNKEYCGNNYILAGLPAKIVRKEIDWSREH